MGEHTSATSRRPGHDRLDQAQVEQKPAGREQRNQALGRFGEELAVGFLESRGYRVLERNWRCRHGEIDIIATRGGHLAFIEVKTRSSNNFGHPFEAISRAKLHRMHLLARLWCSQHPAELSRARLDVIGILAPRGSKPVIEHLEGVHA